jgi:nicotinamidase-related amidase
MSEPPLLPSAERTALVLVDIQGFTVIAPLAPRSGKEVLGSAVRLAERCRAAGILVVIAQAGGGPISLRPPADLPLPKLEFPPNAHLVPEALGPREGDVVLTKYNWGAFYGTPLDLHLRRRGIDTIILGGIATNYGVESTARHAHERGYAQVLVEDAMAAFTAEEHRLALETTLPRIGRIRRTDEVLAAIEGLSG